MRILPLAAIGLLTFAPLAQAQSASPAAPARAPLSFVENRGQWETAAHYVAQVGSVWVRLEPDGSIDLAHLEELLQAPEYRDRMRIGSFSAASNVTGIRTDVRRISSLLHRYGAQAA